MGRVLTADFEATTDPHDCRVWAYGISDVNAPEYFHYGCYIWEFIEYARNSNNADFWFHNLEYDGEFIISYLLSNGYEHVTDRKYLRDKTFTTLISNMGKIYTIKIVFEKKGKHTNSVNIYDSSKIIPLSVKRIAIDFGLPILKGEIDYDAHNGKDKPPTEKEVDYLRNDVEIMARALQWFATQEFNKMTIGSNALLDYKETITQQKFRQWFPEIPLELDKMIRQAYKGGFTWLDNKYKDKDINNTVLVFDVNSLYPSRMHDCLLPYGEPLNFDGKYKKDKAYPLYIQMLTCQFELKPNHIPTIQLKHGFIKDVEYATSSNDKFETLCLTNIDLELFLEHYDVYNITWQGGWKFKGSKQLFDIFIDKWADIKAQATDEGNLALRSISKLFMNSIYGKFATRVVIQGKIPYLDDNGVVKYKLGEEETKKGVYLPCGVFITAYARLTTISSAQAIRTAYANKQSDIDIIYCDTDSLHCTSPSGKTPESIDIHPTKLGAWKHESTCTRARFLKQKCYFETHIISDKAFSKMQEEEQKKCYTDKNNIRVIDKITCAGMPDTCHVYVNWDNFHIGAEYQGKLKKKHVRGGVVLMPSPHKIR